VNHPHPASQLTLGLAVLLAASSRNGMELFLAFSLLTVVALFAARSHLSLLVRRSRWLLLAMLLMFGWLTPGTPLPGIPGASREGLLLAADNLERFLIALAVVALILSALPPVQLVAGIRSLLAPLVPLHISRDRIAVRLALTLQEVESSRHAGVEVRDPVAGVLTLPTPAFGASDFLLGLFSAALLLAAWLT
jgi:energy-coupling factor transporter transmembrane protein EcfT